MAIKFKQSVMICMYYVFLACRGIGLSNNTVGIAHIGTMCTPGLSVSINQDGGRSLTASGTIAAHEIGHNFNMRHDEGS